MCGTLWVTTWSRFGFTCYNSRIWAAAMQLEGNINVHPEDGA